MTAMTKAEELDGPFEGDQKAAVARLRRMVRIACEYLPAAKLNRTSYSLAVYLDVAIGTRLVDAVDEELDGEQAKHGRHRPKLSAADRRLFRQFGIKG
jgi:hypothetical protein